MSFTGVEPLYPQITFGPRQLTLNKTIPGITDVTVKVRFEMTGEKFQFNFKSEICGYEEIKLKYTEPIFLQYLVGELQEFEQVLDYPISSFFRSN